MKTYLLAAVAALSLVSAAQGQETDTSQTIRLRYTDAKSITNAVKTIAGIDELTCDFKHNSITVRGSEKAVATYASQIRLADVLPTLYRVKARLVRCTVDKNGKSIETILQEPIVTGAAGQAAMISVIGVEGGYSLEITPNTDSYQNVSLAVEVRELGEQGEVVKSGKTTRRIALGQTVRITGMTDATDKSLRRSVQQGQIVTGRGEYTGYYVDVTPTMESPGGSATL
jgi:hypothetical protein